MDLCSPLMIPNHLWCEKESFQSSYVWKRVLVHLTLLQQPRCDGLDGSQCLGAGGADQRLRQQEAVVSCVPKLEGEGVRDPVPVGPVDGAARTHICGRNTEIIQDQDCSLVYKNVSSGH